MISLDSVSGQPVIAPTRKKKGGGRTQTQNAGGDGDQNKKQVIEI